MGQNFGAFEYRIKCFEIKEGRGCIECYTNVCKNTKMNDGVKEECELIFSKGKSIIYNNNKAEHNKNNIVIESTQEEIY